MGWGGDGKGWEGGKGWSKGGWGDGKGAPWGQIAQRQLPMGPLVAGCFVPPPVKRTAGT